MSQVYKDIIKRLIELKDVFKFPDHTGKNGVTLEGVLANFEFVETAYLQDRDISTTQFISDAVKTRNGSKIIDILKELIHCKQIHPNIVKDWVVGSFLRSGIPYHTQEPIVEIKLAAGISRKYKLTDQEAKNFALRNFSVLGKADRSLAARKTTSRDYMAYLNMYKHLQTDIIKDTLGEEFLTELLKLEDLKERGRAVFAQLTYLLNKPEREAATNKEGSDKMLEKMKEMHEPKPATNVYAQPESPYIHFLGRSHLIGPVQMHGKTAAEEIELLQSLMWFKITEDEVATALIFVTSFIHRSEFQKEIVSYLFGESSLVHQQEPRQRGIEVLDYLAKALLASSAQTATTKYKPTTNRDTIPEEVLSAAAKNLTNKSDFKEVINEILEGFKAPNIPMIKTGNSILNKFFKEMVLSDILNESGKRVKATGVCGCKECSPKPTVSVSGPKGNTMTEQLAKLFNVPVSDVVIMNGVPTIPVAQPKPPTSPEEVFSELAPAWLKALGNISPNTAASIETMLAKTLGIKQEHVAKPTVSPIRKLRTTEFDVFDVNGELFTTISATLQADGETIFSYKHAGTKTPPAIMIKCVVLKSSIERIMNELLINYNSIDNLPAAIYTLVEHFGGEVTYCNHEA